MTLVAKHLIISGLVQGVFFRAWTVETARSLGVQGWVRNCANGDVEAVVQGDEEIVIRLIEKLWIGPPAARVADIHIMDQAPADFTGFEKRATA
ncbi:MAG TPA: acylphosphatase [Sphingobium sp.]|uniref:acylphosphatase n=1 Tax=Sphingobium sp. TaxID=1912891 RepID=UPI002ED05895